MQKFGLMGQPSREWLFFSGKSHLVGGRVDPPRVDLAPANDTTFGLDETMVRRVRLVAVFVVVTVISGCATVAGGLIGAGVGVATGHPVSGALIGTGVGMMIDTAPRQNQ